MKTQLDSQEIIDVYTDYMLNLENDTNVNTKNIDLKIQNYFFNFIKLYVKKPN
jgi:hypothetical protein